MDTEKELKFVLKTLPDNLPNGRLVEQTYLDLGNPEVRHILKENFPDVDLGDFIEARVRIKSSGESTKRSMTLRVEGSLIKAEAEKEIYSNPCDNLLVVADPEKGRISRIRSEIDLEDRLITEIDRYQDKLAGLVSLEVEIKSGDISEEEAGARVAKLFSGAEDVTEIKAYKNSEPALIGGLDELEAAIKNEDEQRMIEGHLPIQ